MMPEHKAHAANAAAMQKRTTAVNVWWGWGYLLVCEQLLESDVMEVVRRLPMPVTVGSPVSLMVDLGNARVTLMWEATLKARNDVG